MSMRKTWAAALAAMMIFMVGCGSLQQDNASGQAGKGDSEYSGGWELDVAQLQRGIHEKNKNGYSTGWYNLEWQKLASNDWRDLFKMTTIAGDHRLESWSHLFGQFTGQDDVWIPYADQGLITDPTNADVSVANGSGGLVRVPGVKGDTELVKVLCPNGPGDIGISLKHEKPKDLILDVAAAATNEKQNKEMMKLYDHHIQLWVCVDDGQGNTRLVTLNNPTNYAKDSQSLDGSAFSQKGVYGGLGTRAYTNIFFRFNYGQQQAGLERAFNDNIRSWAVIFNSISWFPSDYDGNDPLRAYSPKTVREHAAMAVHAVINTAGARAWWTGQKANYLYCAEYAHLAAAAGLAVPLNEQSIVGLKAPGFPTITSAMWAKFSQQILTGQARDGRHYIDTKNRTNSGEGWGMTNPIRRGVIARIPLSEAPADLQAFETYVDDGNRQAAGCGLGEDAAACLAFNPMTSADMVRYFLATFIPRYPVYNVPQQQRAAQEQAIGQLQANVLFSMREGLFQAVVDERMDSATKQQVRAGIFDVVAGITGCTDANNDGAPDGPCGPSVLTGTYDSYPQFLAAVNADPAFLAAQQLVTQGATPYFTPPSMFHVRANGWHSGLLGMDYIAHGMHFSVVKPKGALPTTPTIAPASTVAEPVYTGQACYDRTDRGPGWFDYSMHQCVDTSVPGFAQTICGGRDVASYCPGAASIRCCVR